ncbi:MAG: T9SS type A sorting domain-containing protein [Bacteroidetes bacterium]|nr:T9SS type A sorting domain-containing protein [Bacteroidota bacterium]
MKKIIFLLIALTFVTFGMKAQNHQACSHKASFQKSWISDTLDAISYTIYLNDIDFVNQEINAQTDVLLSSKIDNLDHITLELQALTVDSVFIDDEKIESFSHSGNFLLIPLSMPISSGENVAASIYYHGQPFHEDWGGFHWSGGYAFNLGVGFVSIPHNLGKTWFPCIDDFRDRATYELYVTVDNALDAVGGGVLQEVVINGDGTHTYHWKLDQTIPTYLASVAVGDYARWTGTFNGINGDIPIGIWVKPQDSSKVDGTFQHLDEMMALFEEKFGPYRWDRIGYVGTGIGAMEHVTNIALPHNMINGGTSYETYVAHELSHMWFGDNVTCATAEDMWLNEGWAVFSDALVQQALYGDEQYREFFRDMHKNVIQFCHTSGGDGSYFPINQIPQEVTYGMSAYDRGATIAHSLRGYLGDELFFGALAAYQENFKYAAASSYDMRDIMTTYTGIDLAPWFDNWVFHSGTPHYSVDSMTVLPNTAGAEVTVYLKQKRHGPAFIGDANKIELTFLNDQWTMVSEEVMFDGETGSAVLQLPIVPEAVIPDLNEKQCDAITDEAMTIKEPGSLNFVNTFFEMEVEAVTDSAFIWVGHQWAPPDPLQNPIQGLTISDYRYWIIDGIFPEDFNATGVFWYNRNAHLDDGIINSEADSVVILYRPSPAYDWQFIDFTKIGLWSIGKLFIENLQKGEYTIAVCDDTFVGTKKHKIESLGFRVSPNPSGSLFHIETKYAGTLHFYDSTGKPIGMKTVKKNQKSLTWQPNHLSAGTYFVRYISDDHKPLGVEKLILTKDQ